MTVQQKRLKVFLLGDSCIDEYVYVTSKTNPESPAPLLVASDHIRKLGMAENVGACLERLGFTVTPCMPSAITDLSLKTRYIDEHGNTLVRIDHDRRPVTQPQLVKNVDLNTFDAVVISDYDKGWVTTETIKYVMHNFSGPVFLDTKKPNLDDFNKCIIKVNQKEFNAATKSQFAPVYVTLGSEGAIHAGIKYPTLKVECVDPCGAGDAFLAGLVYGYFQQTWRPSIHYALVCGAVSTTKLGTYQPTLLDLQRGLTIYDAQNGLS